MAIATRVNINSLALGIMILSSQFLISLTDDIKVGTPKRISIKPSIVGKYPGGIDVFTLEFGIFIAVTVYDIPKTNRIASAMLSPNFLFILISPIKHFH
jgi:hypothetical protein